MSFQNFESDSYCVGGRHRTATTKIYGNITRKCSKLFFGYCSICNRKKIRQVGTIQYKQKVSVVFLRFWVKKDLIYQNI